MLKFGVLQWMEQLLIEDELPFTKLTTSNNNLIIII